GDFRRLAEALARRLQSPRTRPAEKKALLRRLAAIQADKLGRTDAAFETHQQLLELDPESRPSILFLAQEARRVGDRRLEERYLESVSTLPGERMEPPAEAEIHGRLAQIHLEAGREGQAEAGARRAVDLFPRQPAALAVLDEIL